MDDWEALQLHWDQINPKYTYNGWEPNCIKLIAEIDHGGGYDWDVFYVFQNTYDGSLKYYTSAGCSCDGPMNGVCSWWDLDNETITDSTWAQFCSSLERMGDNCESVEVMMEVAKVMREKTNE